MSTGLELHATVAQEGYAFVQGLAMRELLASHGPLTDGEQFQESWNDLEVDPYLTQARYRRRRHAVYGATRTGPIVRKPHQPHYQALEYNPLYGGISRWFEPIRPEIGDGASMRTVLAFCRSLFNSLAPATNESK